MSPRAALSLVVACHIASSGPIACSTRADEPATPPVSSSPSERGVADPDHATVVEVDLGTGDVVSTFPTGPAPLLLAVASGHVWTLNLGDGTLTHVDPGADSAETIDVGEVVGLASDGRDLWVARDGNVLARLDGASGRQEAVLQVTERALFAPRSAGFVGVGGGSLWLTVPPGDGHPQDELWRIALPSGEVIAEIGVGPEPNPPFIRGGRVWVVGKGDQSLLRIDSRTHEATPVTIGSFPWSLAAGAGSLWIGHHVSPMVRRFDPETLAVSAEIPFETDPRGLTFAGGTLWVATEDGLHAVDPTTNEVVRSISLGRFPPDTGPIGIAIVEGSIWVSVE